MTPSSCTALTPALMSSTIFEKQSSQKDLGIFNAAENLRDRTGVALMKLHTSLSGLLNQPDAADNDDSVLFYKLIIMRHATKSRHDELDANHQLYVFEPNSAAPHIRRCSQPARSHDPPIRSRSSIYSKRVGVHPTTRFLGGPY